MEFKTIKVTDVVNTLPRQICRLVKFVNGKEVSSENREDQMYTINGRKKTLNDITTIVVHHDAEKADESYDPLTRYKSTATVHGTIRNWLGSAYKSMNQLINGGTGSILCQGTISYHFKIARNGNIYQVNDILRTGWHASNLSVNQTSIAICLDGNFTIQEPSQKQIDSLKALLDELCTQHPEFPAGKANVFGHKEIKGSATACPGSIVTLIKEYRETGTIKSAKPILTNSNIPNTTMTNIFADVPENYIGATEIKFLRDKGIISGYNSSVEPDITKRKFMPTEKISRAEMAMLMYRLYGTIKNEVTEEIKNSKI